MLSTYNEKLNELREKMAQSRKAESVLRELRVQEKELASRVGELAQQLQMEQEDVDRLSGGFRSIYYAIIGKRAEMLEKEQAEVLAAAMKLDAAKKELEAVQQEIFRVDWEAGAVRRYEREYQAALMEKVEAMKGLSAYAGRIAELEEKKELLAIQLRETNEAMTAGRSVLGQLELIGQSLTQAEECAQWDLFTGKSLITHAAKWSYLDNAQQHTQELKARLRKFRTELSDLSIQTEFSLSGSEGLRLADWFFDGFFVDWTVLSRIRESGENLKAAERHVQKIMNQLRRIEKEIKHKHDELDLNIRKLAEEA